MQGRYLTEIPPQKRRNTAHAFGISDLPDEILIFILSFLRTKEVVQTSLLAKRFKNLWASASVLNFDLHEFIPDGSSSEDPAENEVYLREYEEKFSKFVDGVLKHRNSSFTLDSFKLVWDVAEGNPTPATSWLDTVAKLKPKSVSIHIFSENYFFKVPNSFYASESLQQLMLHLGYESINPRYVNFPCLKTLTIDCILIEDEVMQKLLGLPALEEMVLYNCGFEISDISSQTLKRLVLDCYHNDFSPPDISISTPNLLHLEIHSWVMGKLKFKNLESLVNARIHYKDFDAEGPLSLMGLSNVTYLELMLDEWCLLV
jgi:F-box domain